MAGVCSAACQHACQHVAQLTPPPPTNNATTTTTTAAAAAIKQHQEERTSWQLLDEEDRPKFVPAAFDSLRAVPAYADFVKERFERCLDLYLCPRVRLFSRGGRPAEGEQAWGGSG